MQNVQAYWYLQDNNLESARATLEKAAAAAPTALTEADIDQGIENSAADFDTAVVRIKTTVAVLFCVPKYRFENDGTPAISPRMSV